MWLGSLQEIEHRASRCPGTTGKQNVEQGSFQFNQQGGVTAEPTVNEATHELGRYVVWRTCRSFPEDCHSSWSSVTGVSILHFPSLSMETPNYLSIKFSTLDPAFHHVRQMFEAYWWFLHCGWQSFCTLEYCFQDCNFFFGILDTGLFLFDSFFRL